MWWSEVELGRDRVECGRVKKSRDERGWSVVE